MKRKMLTVLSVLMLVLSACVFVRSYKNRTDTNKSQRGANVPLIPDARLGEGIYTKTVNERERQDIEISSEFLSEKKAISIAMNHSRSTSDTNAIPEISFTNNYYIVSFHRHKNPFRGGELGFDCLVTLHAKTGKLISVRTVNSGVTGWRMSRKTGAGQLGEVPEAENYQKRVGNALEELHRRIMNGQSLASIPIPNMISDQEAIVAASKQVSDRNYDRRKTPWAVLVNDVYIVSFWRLDQDVFPEWGNILYDTRVGIDAKTGEFLAMDITRSKK